MKCEYCNKEYKSKYNLLYHQKTAKFCLKLQNNANNKDQDQNEEKENRICIFCDKIFMNKYNLKKHLNECKNKKEKQLNDQFENIIKEKDEEIIKIKKILKSKNEKIKMLEEKIGQMYEDHYNAIKNINNNLIDKLIEKNF